jgi:hypothetical protein
MPADLPRRIGWRTGLVRWLVLLCVVTLVGAIGLILRAKGVGAGLVLPTAAEEAQAGLALWAGCQLALFMAVLVWMHGAVANAQAQAPDDRRIGPWMAVVWWFVPLLNFFQPVRVMSQTWNTSVDGAANINGPAAAPVAGWWILAALGCFWLPLSLQALIADPGLEEAYGHIGTLGGALVVWIGAMGCLASCVKTIGGAQRARGREPYPALPAQPAME